MKIYIASDHGGFELKKHLISKLQNKYEIFDLGPFELVEDDDYPDFAYLVANKIAGTEDKGILICRSGNGMVIAANKVNGAYAALCFSKNHAEKAVSDDNANIVCLDADYDTKDSPEEIVLSFLNTDFAGMDTKYGRRFKKIQEIEKSLP